MTQVVDVEAFALENACRLLSHQIPDGGIGQSVAVVDIGASSTTFSVLHDLKVIYTRDFNFGGQQLTEEIMRTYGLSMEDAGRAKKQGGLPSNYQPEVLEPFIDDMTQQVSRSLQFYLASGGGREQPDMILVCGGCANIPGIADVISSRVGIPTEVGDPLGQMKISSKAKSQGVQQRCDSTAYRLRPCTEELRLICQVLIYSPGARRNARSVNEISVSPSGGAVVAAIARRNWLPIFSYSQMISDQEARNQRLTDEIVELEKSIAEIDGLERQKERLLARMEIIEELQKSRPEIVHLVRRARAATAGRRLPDRHETNRLRASKFAASRSPARACRR